MAEAVRIAAVVLLAIGAPAAAELTQQVDLDKPARPALGPNEAMIVLRPFAKAMAGDNRILFHRIDPATGAVVRDNAGKPVGGRVTFSYSLFGGKKGERPLRVLIVPAGEYVLAGRTFNMTYTDIFCLGAPRFTLVPGAVVYVGDYEMLALEKMADGERRNAMRPSYDLDAARAALAAAYPALAPSMTAWTPINGATFKCEGDEFWAFAAPAP